MNHSYSVTMFFPAFLNGLNVDLVMINERNQMNWSKIYFKIGIKNYKLKVRTWTALNGRQNLNTEMDSRN